MKKLDIRSHSILTVIWITVWIQNKKMYLLLLPWRRSSLSQVLFLCDEMLTFVLSSHKELCKDQFDADIAIISSKVALFRSTVIGL